MPDEALEGLGQPLRELQRRFLEMMEPHRPELWRYCLRLTASPWDAEDLVQETLARGFARLTRLWQPLDPRAYLFRVATNAWIDALRRAKATIVDLESVEDLPDEGAAPDPAEMWAGIETLVTRLPPLQRVVVLLVEALQFRPAEVAPMIGTTEGAVRAALHRARATLRKPADGEAPAAAPVPPPNAVTARYLDAFNRRDAEAIAALFHADATVHVVGIVEEQGIEAIRRSSLAVWAADPTPQWAELARVGGRDVICVFYKTRRHERALGRLILQEIAGDRIAVSRDYFFTPELIRHVADALGVPAHTHGYRYTPSNDA